MAYAVTQETPIFSRSTYKSGSDDIYTIRIPSVSIINLILATVSPEHMEMMFGFGRIGLETLLDMHMHGMHPSFLYNNLIFSNLTEAHGRKCGPVIAWMHDIGHILWASLLQKRGMDLVLKQYIPCLQAISEECCSLARNEDDKKRLISLFEDLINEANDFEVTPIRKNLFTNEEIKNFIKKTIERVHFSLNMSDVDSGFSAQFSSIFDNARQSAKNEGNELLFEILKEVFDEIYWSNKWLKSSLSYDPKIESSTFVLFSPAKNASVDRGLESKKADEVPKPGQH